MSPRSFGIEGITDEDRAYRGSRFSDVREALFANPYQAAGWAQAIGTILAILGAAWIAGRQGAAR